MAETKKCLELPYIPIAETRGFTVTNNEDRKFITPPIEVGEFFPTVG